MLHCGTYVLLVLCGAVSCSGNSAESRGGALFVDLTSGWHLTQCVLQHNRAQFGGALLGWMRHRAFKQTVWWRTHDTTHTCPCVVSIAAGGMYVESSATMVVNQTQLISNQASRHGGAMVVDDATLHCFDCSVRLTNTRVERVLVGVCVCVVCICFFFVVVAVVG